MRSVSQHLCTLTVVLGCVCGCASESQIEEDATSTAKPAAVHAHASVGPHGGSLIELGNETYHGEILHDDSQVTIYVLNGSADQQVAIAAAEIAINGSSDGSPMQFSLAATPDEGDPTNRSSRFVGSDSGLVAMLDAENAKAQLVVSIEGKSYRGAIAHRHDHDGNSHDEHAHDSDDDHDH